MGPLITTFILVVSLGIIVAEDDEPFSIGLGVLSPSYTQTVGKDEKNIIKVNFRQKEDGVSYTITDPQSGSNSYYNFGASADAAGPAPEVVKELQADQFSQTIRAPQPQTAYNEPQGIPPPRPPAPVHSQQPAGFSQPPVDYAQPPPAYVPPLAAYAPPPAVYAPLPASYAPPPAAYAPPPAAYAPPPAAYALPPAAYAPPPAAYAPPPVQHANPVFFNYPHAPAPQPGVPVVVQYNSMHSASPAAVPFNSQPAPAIFSYHAIEGQRYANQAATSNIVMAPAPFQVPLAPLPYQAGPLRDFGYAQQPFFLPQAPAGFIQGRFQAPGGGPIAHGYGQVISPGVGQYTIQNRNHGGHTAEDVAALKQQKVQ